MILPQITKLEIDSLLESRRRLWISAEGFEERTLSFGRALPGEQLFERALVFKYSPERKSRLTELLAEVRPRSRECLPPVNFYRFEPAKTEFELAQMFPDLIQGIEEIVLDISVMSKLLILMLVYALRNFQGDLKVIYTEPQEYAPSQAEYEKHRDRLELALTLPSYGVHQVVRTPALSSTVMLRSPTLVLAFTSFNEQLIRALLSSINPSRLLLVNGVPPLLKWRERATQEIHSKIIQEYNADNDIDESGCLIRRTSTLDYSETVQLLADIYAENCFHHRIVVAPTGSKMQALAAGLVKLACSDVHIEYPTPESFYIEGYSSVEMRQIHELTFYRFARLVGEFSSDPRFFGVAADGCAA